ncbi:PREDICTED: VIN3-like protein 2 [Nicotiana attenuata]|uniref:Vin3-like protein 2 n=1 Tax=Nicotiana attenuata TaxID=49451 RepID=A0A314LC46_NICAT|nr:PREDICTED: VIN3-like protein 2 [Nicotiana attenuata]OIT39178.1 vin3-like protein 2 [Nicotiana attenuata]
MRKFDGTGISAMESTLTGLVLDPTKFSQLSLEEKRQLVYEISQCSEDAPKILSSLTRRELLEIICAEMGEERKYSGYTKFKMIDQLLKLVSCKSSTNTGSGFKRQRKQENQCQTLVQNGEAKWEMESKTQFLLCHNLACRATLEREDVFCKRCCCCICHQYDDNKDPSLWLTCESDSPDEIKPCGLSCHLKCALEHEQSGILKNCINQKLDGDFYCVSCGKVNGLMRTLRKQLMTAKEARRVDVLCLRISLSRKILEKTEKYKGLLKLVELAVEMLKNEVGPLAQASEKMDRRIVNRLSCGTAVQKLCGSALEAFDSMLPNQYFNPMTKEEPPMPCRMHFEEQSPSKITIVFKYDDRMLKELIGFKLWYRKSTADEYPDDVTFIALSPATRFKLDGLDPSTQYFCKVSFFSKTTTLGVQEVTWVTPALHPSCKSGFDEVQRERENATTDSTVMHAESMSSTDNKLTTYDPNAIAFPTSPLSKMLIPLASPVSSAPATPCQTDGSKEAQLSDYEYSVGIIRKLEHEGLIETDFRVKFLTWFSLKATTQQRKVVRVFIDTFIDDHSSMAGQLMDTFMDEICREQKVAQHELCSRFWH